MNKFEQVFSDDHQMSIAGEGVGTQDLCLGGAVPRSPPPPHENITFPQLRLRAVKMKVHETVRRQKKKHFENVNLSSLEKFRNFFL